MISSFAKCLSILDFFQEGRVSTRLDDLVEALGTSRATTYRYVGTLCDAGLLAPAAGGVYVLGPRIIEMDRLMRISDPLLLAGSPVMHEVSARRKQNMMLARFYRDSIMCVDIAWPDATIPANFERGKPMSLFKGAMAKVVLANLSPYQLKNIALNHADEIKAAGMSSNWSEFRAYMAELAKQGYAITKSEMVSGTGGISAPVFDGERKIMGSITFVVSESQWASTDFDKLRRQLLEAAERITQRIAQQPSDAPSTPSAGKVAAKTPARKRAAAKASSTR
ncbi:IclR family transcriptional regulator [Xenophilus arseniciresistens]|uniref:IclR family transcriptional regulator n=1 Tax=Xenophilus arseniciresistens TaxID=1283306 RepID=A0AAE3NCS4_9BURK|nr:IclR family transcriptional regulator [Xenophilus arseniciresistens]MDA7419193.1 IclR family transcriptional regulator [Xenophilus arseniciresistens]